MKASLKIIRSGFFLLALSLLPGCEGGESNSAPAGTANVAGRWYKNPEGVMPNGWQWYWANLWLEQDGTSVSGTYKWEEYDSIKVSGNITSNELILVSATGESIVGTVNGDTFKCQNNFRQGAYQIFQKVDASAQ